MEKYGIEWVLDHDERFRYMLLSRMQSDCEYYLGFGQCYGNHLWAGNEYDQIEYMKQIWNSFPQDKKPEWLTWEQILQYERTMIRMKNRKFKFQVLGLEVTQRCNQNCRHCLRGEQRNVTMNQQVIDAIFSKTKLIRLLALTGGEPSLEPGVISTIADSAKRNGCEIRAFSIATNAKECSDQFIEAVRKLYSYCTDKRDCRIHFSRDRFHEPDFDKRILQFAQDGILLSPIDEVSVIDRGKARENEIGEIAPYIPAYIYDLDDTYDVDIGDVIYINANGYVMLDCDLPYCDQLDNKITNIRDSSAFYDVIHKRFPKNRIPDYNAYTINLWSEEFTELRKEMYEFDFLHAVQRYDLLLNHQLRWISQEFIHGDEQGFASAKEITQPSDPHIVKMHCIEVESEWDEQPMRVFISLAGSYQDNAGSDCNES